jgi:hypothetical protein
MSLAERCAKGGDRMTTKLRLLVVALAIVAIGGPSGLTARADGPEDLGFLPGGSLDLLPSALIIEDTDPVPPGAAKEPLYDSDPFTCPTGATLTVGPFGFVVLNTAGPKYVNGQDSKVIAEVSVKNGIPNTTYQIYLNQDPGDCPTTATGTITTNSQGNGNGHVEETRFPGSETFWVSAFDPLHYPGPKSILRSPAAALD